MSDIKIMIEETLRPSESKSSKLKNHLQFLLPHKTKTGSFVRQYYVSPKGAIKYVGPSPKRNIYYCRDKLCKRAKTILPGVLKTIGVKKSRASSKHTRKRVKKTHVSSRTSKRKTIQKAIKTHVLSKEHKKETQKKKAQKKAETHTTDYKTLSRNYELHKHIFRVIDKKKGDGANPFKMEKVDTKMVARYANRTGILTTSTVNKMLTKVLKHMKAHKNHELHYIYKNLDCKSLMRRLLTQRPLYYFMGYDYYALRDFKTRGSGEKKYISVTRAQRGKYLHPKEGLIASYLGIVAPSIVINDGNRKNQSRPQGNAWDYPLTFVAGQVGARLEVEGTDCRSLFPSKNEKMNIFETAVREMLETRTKEDGHSNLYRARTSIVIEALLKASKKVHKYTKKKPIVQITGLGLGAWAGTNKSARGLEFLQGLVDAIKRCQTIVKSYITELQLIWVPKLNKSQTSEIKKYVGVRETKLGPFDSKLNSKSYPVLSSFAWDGMSFLGNEWYAGKLQASGDPAMTSATSIGYLGNPLINPDAYSRLF
jgi:hypothetical protein